MTHETRVTTNTNKTERQVESYRKTAETAVTSTTGSSSQGAVFPFIVMTDDSLDR